MSHYTVMILTKSPTEEALGQALAPFDENTQVEPYRDYVDVDKQPADFWAVKSLREDGLLPAVGELTWDQVREAYVRKYGQDGAFLVELEVDPDSLDSEPRLRAFEMSTYNPDSKWDWWTVGGRWAQSLRHVDGSEVDQLQRRHLDAERMRTEAADDFRRRYFQGPEIYDLHGHRSWDEIYEAVGQDAAAARETYWNQRSIEEFKKVLPENQRFFLGVDLADRVLVGPKEFERQVEIARAAAVPCFATLDLDGRWSEPGSMGWFGVSSDTEGTRIGYYGTMNGLIENLDGEVWLTVVDCHI